MDFGVGPELKGESQEEELHPPQIDQRNVASAGLCIALVALLCHAIHLS
jgi:preprotein translocase subunit Sec61beta